MDWKSPVSAQPLWSEDISNRPEKEAIARQIAALAKSSEVIGIGSGSSAYLTLLALGERVKREKLDLMVIPTSVEIALTCGRLGLTTTSLQIARPDWGFDGADEVDPGKRLIKGRGGALLREKILMASSPKTFILADPSKRVARLGGKFPIPVEVLPDALHCASQRIKGLGATDISLRMAKGKDGPIITENGNLLLDARFDEISDNLEKELSAIAGVIESGLFIGYPVEIIGMD